MNVKCTLLFLLFHISTHRTVYSDKCIVRRNPGVKASLTTIQQSPDVKEIIVSGVPYYTLWSVLQHLPVCDIYLFIEQHTRVNIQNIRLLDINISTPSILGHPLQDTQPTVIHHYKLIETKTFYYPRFDSGWIMTGGLVKLLIATLQETPPDSFTIDIQHEFALYILQHLNISLQALNILCVVEDVACLSWPGPMCHVMRDRVERADVVVAVKTTQKYHETRLSVVRDTWGTQSYETVFYSNISDVRWGTIDIGVPNTERGHCAKLRAILKHLHTNYNHKKWFIINDDDTIVDLDKLRSSLSCYQPTEHLYLGEVYGYISDQKWGYHYITGGGGTVLSWFTLQAIVSSIDQCECFSDDSPDDMWLGLCAKNLNIPATSQPGMHQARPQDYSSSYLTPGYQISFHKHNGHDPRQVWREIIEQSIERDEL